MQTQSPTSAQYPPQIKAIVLIIEHRCCENCDSEHTVSNPHLLARVGAALGGTKLLPLEKVTTAPPRTLTHKVPCERQHIYTTCEMCHLCFDNYEPAGQHELWPHPIAKAEATSPKTWKREPDAPLTLTLEDF